MTLIYLLFRLKTLWNLCSSARLSSSEAGRTNTI